MLRCYTKKNKPIILVYNKAEAFFSENNSYEAFSLGFGKAVVISAEHGKGIFDLHDAILEEINNNKHLTNKIFAIPRHNTDDKTLHAEEKLLRIAVVGRPNVGKSTLINHFLGEDRLLTGDEAGITRDSINIEWNWKNYSVQIFDTAGIRRQSRITEKIEKLSIEDSLKAIRSSEVVVVVLDATNEIERQDFRIITSALSEGKATVLAFNKWDVIQNREERFMALHQKVMNTLFQAQGIHIITISSKTGEGLDQLMQSIINSKDLWNKHISTSQLNNWLNMTQEKNPPPSVSGRRRHLKYITQVKSRPPSFIIFCTCNVDIPKSYVRYLINRMRIDFNLPGIPIRIHFRLSKNPYV